MDDADEHPPGVPGERGGPLLPESLLAASPAGMGFVDQQMRYVYVNDALAAMNGIPKREHQGKRPRDLFPPVAAEIIESLLHQVLESGEPLVNLELRGSSPARPGVPRDWLASYFPIRDQSGTIRGVGAIISDVTERRRTVEELEVLTRQLEEQVQERTRQLTTLLRELETFSYSVSHDLRASLRGIMFFAQLLDEEYASTLDAQGQAYLRRLRERGKNLQQLIDGILVLSRLSREEMHHESVDLSRMARSIAEDLRQTQPARLVEFSIQEGVTVQGDGRLLRVVMENLLGNAWKYTGKKSKTRIEFGVANQDGQVAYYVRDNGIGFDPAKAGRLFVPFQRLHTSQQFEGTGIGLASVKRVIERHGGRVWAEGRIGEGATFSFTLGPQAKAPLAQAAPF